MSRAERGEVGRQHRCGDDRRIAHRLTSSEIGSPGAIWKPGLRVLPQHDARRHAGVGVIADDRDAEAARAQHIRGAVAVDADQVRHHVGARRARRG